MKIQIWIEGHCATGESGTAEMIAEYDAKDFDAAVAQYMKDHPDEVDIYKPEHFYTKADYLNRRSKYKIWGCALFDNEIDARKAFG